MGMTKHVVKLWTLCEETWSEEYLSCIRQRRVRQPIRCAFCAPLLQPVTSLNCTLQMRINQKTEGHSCFVRISSKPDTSCFTQTNCVTTLFVLHFSFAFFKLLIGHYRLPFASQFGNSTARDFITTQTHSLHAIITRLSSVIKH